MPNHVSKSVRLILKPFLFDYTITKDAQVKRLRLPRRKRGGKTEIPMQGLAGFAWGFLFLRLRDRGGIYFLLSLSSAVSSAGIQLLQSQPPRFTLLAETSYSASLTRREVQSIPSLLISKVVREGAIYVFILVVLLFGLVRCPMHGRHGAMDFWLIRITVNQLSGNYFTNTLRPFTM